MRLGSLPGLFSLYRFNPALIKKEIGTMRIFAIILVACLGYFQNQAVSQSLLPEKNNSSIKSKPAIKPNAYAFNLKDVRLLPGSPFKHAMDIDGGYMLALDVNRLLSRFYKNAGLPVKDSVYG